MLLSFKGICSGTEEKTGRTSGKAYKITKFVEVPSMKVLEVFGDIGLPASMQVQEYALQCDVDKANNVIVIAGGAGKNKPV